MKKTIRTTELKQMYEYVCNQYIRKFCNKQRMDFDGWVADEIGGIAEFASQYFFNMSDIMMDINTRQPIGLILNWQNEGVDAHFENDKSANINYRSYIMGLRFDMLNENKD